MQLGRHLVRPHAVRHPVRRSHRRRLERRCPDCHDRGAVQQRVDGVLHWTTCPTCGRSDQD